MLTDDRTRRPESARERLRQPRGFLESQGAYGIGWVASMEANRQARGGLSWAEAAMANGVTKAEVNAARERRHQAEREAWLLREQERVVRDVTRSAGAMPRGESLRQETQAEVLVIREVETARQSARPTSIPPLGRDELR
jgi:hypothetical protein